MKTALKLMIAVIGLVVFGLLAGCGTTEMFKDRLTAQGKRDEIASKIEDKKYAAAAECYKAYGAAAASGTDIVRVVAMALIKNCEPDKAAPQVAAQQAPLPEVPESGVLTTLRIADTLLGRGISIYGLVSQERIARDGNRTNRDISLGNQAMLGSMFTGQANALRELGGDGFGALRDLGSTALREVKPAQPNITNNGALVIGGGTATLNSGDASGNSGTITKDSPTTITKQTCGATSGAGASASASAGLGTSTQPASTGGATGGAGGAGTVTCTKG